MLRVLAAATALFVAGCHYDLNDPGTEPLAAQFHFPAGIAIDPIRPYLYVTNANADLKYGGGTLQVVNLERFDCAVARMRGAATTGICANPCWTADTGLCTFDPNDPNMIDCDATPFVVGSATVKIGNFAGDIQVLSDGLGVDRRRLFVAVRGDPSITWVDVDLDDPDAAACAGGVTMSCFDNPAAKHAQAGMPGCDRSRLIQDFVQPVNCIGTGPAVGVTCPTASTTLPPEPFALVLDPPGDQPPGLLSDGVTHYRRLVTSHLSGGQVTVIDARGPPKIESISGQFFSPDQLQRHGAFGLAPMPFGGPRGLWYLTSNNQPTIAGFRIADVEVVTAAFSFSLGGVYQSGADGRDIVFDPDGSRAFLAENNPPSVAVIDTQPSPTSAGVPANKLVDVIDVCQQPSRIKVVKEVGPGAPGEAPLVQTRVYVVCFLANQVMVVDPDRPLVLDTILVGRGPNDIVVPSPGAFPTRRAYVTNFGDGSISLIDLEPNDPTATPPHTTHNRVVARIGLPQLPTTQ
jgi:DNA-binding beta-propeller fold protein YncE